MTIASNTPKADPKTDPKANPKKDGKSDMKTDWIAVDWGTSRLRVWAMSHAGHTLAARDSDRGMSTLQTDQYESVLLALVADWLDADQSTPVIVCGMAGSRQGWQEAAYLGLPISLPSGFSATSVATQDRRLQVRILPGLKQDEPADVMRGEETQIAGFLAEYPDFNGVLALPGTHTKWVRIQQQTLIRFHTCMTGELFALLGEQSLLRHSVSHEGWSQTDFDEAFRTALRQPEGFANRLFGLRASSLLHGQSGSAARSRLSAELMGLEIATLHAHFPDLQGLDLAVIGTDTLAQLYCHALALAGLQAQARAGERITLAGLSAAHAALYPSLALPELQTCVS